MTTRKNNVWILAGLLVALCAPAFAAVGITSITPSPKSPQLIGTAITWIVKATDSNPGPLTFQFNVAPPNGSFALAKDFNVGTLKNGIWTAQPFLWVPTGVEGVYRVQVVAKDFTTGETASKTVHYTITPLVTDSMPVAVKTSNPLVALFSAPSCPAGSSMRVSFQQQSMATPAATTNFVNCRPPKTVTFEIAGMYPSTAYTMFSQTEANGIITNGPTVTFTAGSLPSNIPFPNFQVLVPAGPSTDTADSVLLYSLLQQGAPVDYPDVATDLSAKVMWYYYPSDSTHTNDLTRPLANGGLLSIEDGLAWNPTSNVQQLLRQVDLAGNVVRETNTGVIQQQLLAKGATDAGPCNAVSSPPPVGFACLGAFHDDAIQTLPNGYTAVIADIEKIFPPGTQGDTSGLPVDILGDIVIVLDGNWQVVWYSDLFQQPSLSVNRPAVLGETCVNGQVGCPPLFLAPQANQWLDTNSLYYWPQNGDLLVSLRNQNWIVKIDYNNGTGTGSILWRMGADGDFVFNNILNSPSPWFSHQNDIYMANNGAGPLWLYDNGNTGIHPPTGESFGNVLSVNEAALQVTPLAQPDLGVFSPANGSFQGLSNGDYFALDAGVSLTATGVVSYAVEFGATTVLNIQGPQAYRGWRMPSLYAPPAM